MTDILKNLFSFNWIPIIIARVPEEFLKCEILITLYVVSCH